MSAYNRPNRGAASSPILAPRPMMPAPPIQDPSIRSMRLKVLYTFDDENKTVCLARWPQPIEIRTASLDETTQIGVIELKTCIQAIVAASPELVAKLGQDYTVYAYDYSEYETPLVGQGMLSWVLASSSTTPAAPAHQSRTMVTGRVSRNPLGLFSSSPQETLEVKLRLVPVPTSLQSEYIDSMKKYRDLSQMIPPGFDAQAWTSFVKANPGFLPQVNQSRSQSPATGAMQPIINGMEQVQRLLNGDTSQMKPSEARRPLSRAQSCADFEAGQQLPRMPSPALSIQSSASAPKKRGRKPGPKGPRGGRAASKKQEPAPESNDTGYGSNDDRSEDGPAKKRAKITQTAWAGRQNLGKQADSLRVAASTAASVRIHQPTAIRPGADPAHSIEGPPREPTPINDPFSQKPPRRLQPTARSSLRRESSVSEKKVFAAPYEPPSEVTKSLESALTSPENSRADSSPVDIGSSPPVFEGSTVQSSPNLPPLLDHFHDSGFMSSSIDDLFEDEEYRPIDEEDLNMLSQYSRRPDLPGSDPVQPSLPFLHETTNDPPVQSQSHSSVELPPHQSFLPPLARPLNRTVSSGALPEPQLPASDPVRPTSLNRSQTWSGDHASHPASDVAPMSASAENVERPLSRNRRGTETGHGSGVKRKQAIQSKLATSIAAGEMPPFCENCGAIETPTWRKAWVKIHSGTPEHVRISDEEGAIIAWQTLQTDHTGMICLYRIIKRSLLKTDEGFTEILLCNPCGLWLHTRKCMRPKETWDKSQKGPDEKRKRGPASRRPRNGSMSNISTTQSSGGQNICSEPSSPTNTRGEQTKQMEANPQLPLPKRSRASSEERTPRKIQHTALDDAAAAAALQRAIKSSPHKFMGSQQVPIEVGDLTPRPTRRILFPSPSKPANGQASNQSPSKIPSPLSKMPDLANPHSSPEKENRAPSIDRSAFDEFLVKENEIITRSKSSTPSKTKALANYLTTPKCSPKRGAPPTTGDFFSSAAKALFRHKNATPSKRTPTRFGAKGHGALEEVSPFTAHLNQLLSEPNHTDHIDAGIDQHADANTNASPNGSTHTFDFPSLPSLHNSPSGRAGGGGRALEFDFSAFDSQDLISTDVPIPSSPPAWFGMYGNGDEDDEIGRGLWGPGRDDGDSIPGGMLDSSPLKTFDLGGESCETREMTMEKAKGDGEAGQATLA